MGKVVTTKTLSLASVALLAVLTTGCSFVEEQASQAAGQLTEAASQEFVRQACAPIQDGRIDASEMRVLSSIVDSVNGGGLPPAIVNTLQDLASSGDQAPEMLQQQLLQACDDAGAYAN